MEIDVLVCEIGSTTTVVNAFDLNKVKYLGKGVHKTTVDFDVSIGVANAIKDLEKSLGVEKITYKEMYATSSAAGGLKMSVHGLVYDMTVTAAKEAALGAGANITSITSGKIKELEEDKLKNEKPNIILISGGVDFGDEETVIHNAEIIARLKLDVPVIYAGNSACQEDIKRIFTKYDQDKYLKITANVYPKIDQLNIDEVKSIIHDTFEEHIIHAKGMEKISKFVTHNIIPTPGAVMRMAEILYEEIGDLLCFDIGGATTDLHSVTTGSEEFSKVLINPQPTAKRTVEGDLGVYINHEKVVDYIGYEELLNKLDVNESELDKVLSSYKYIPESELEYQVVKHLAMECIKLALSRHAGQITKLYTTSGLKNVAQGKDLTAVKSIIGTGGVLTNFEDSFEIISSINKLKSVNKMYPRENVKILFDSQYIMASLGVLSIKYPSKALKLMKDSLKEEVYVPKDSFKL